MLPGTERARLAVPLIVLVTALAWHGISMLHGVEAPMDHARTMTRDDGAASAIITFTCIAVVAIGIGSILRARRPSFSTLRAPAIDALPAWRPLLPRSMPGRHPPDEGVVLRH
jgi:hypothetical protein